MNEFSSALFIDRVKDNRKEILNAEKQIEKLNANSFEFIQKICELLVVALRISESEFSKLALNATKDYYAYLKATKNNISDEKLENLLQNLEQFKVACKNTLEFSNKDIKRKQAKIFLAKTDLYLNKINNYFLIKRDNKINEELLQQIRSENYLINIKTAVNY